MNTAHPAPSRAPTTALPPEHVPRCVQRTGRRCQDCVECLSVIPDGKTCASCQSFARCEAFGMTTAERRFCDFVPSIYRAARSVVAAPVGEAEQS